MPKFTLLYFNKQFPDDQACRKFLEQELWNNVPTCPYCGNQQKIYRYKNGKLFKCAHCQKQFQVTTGTIYEGSNIPLQKWLLTFYLLSASKKGISSCELAKIIGVTQCTAWHLLHKIRLSHCHAVEKQLQGIVECDETYVGGRHKGKRGRGAEKSAVFGAVERKGNITVTPVENAKRKTLDPIIRRKVTPGSCIMSDEWPAYNKLRDDYTHKVVKHKRKEYVRGLVHTNTIEGAWSHLKRTLLGTYHRPSKKHLGKYCAEFEFNYNTRDNLPETKFRKIVHRNNIRVKYADIV